MRPSRSSINSMSGTKKLWAVVMCFRFSSNVGETVVQKIHDSMVMGAEGAGSAGVGLESSCIATGVASTGAAPGVWVARGAAATPAFLPRLLVFANYV